MAVSDGAMVMKALMTEISPPVEHPSGKVTVVGVGAVGMASAFSMLTMGVASEIALVDVMEDRVMGEVMDMQHGQTFLKKVTIVGGSDYSVTKNSKICVITAGARQQEGESRLNLVQKNVGIFKSIVPNLVKYSPDCLFVVVSNPVDVMTFVTWKLSGLPQHRVIGSGTMLDSSRFRFLVSQRLNVAPGSVHGYIIGEHGDSSVPIWSGVNCGGVLLKEINPKIGQDGDPDNWSHLHHEVVDSAYQIIKLKGYTSWAIGLMVATLCNGILKNLRNVYAVSVWAEGFHGITESVFLSLPSVVGESGVTHVFKQRLDDEEIKKLKESASTLNGVIQDLQW